MPHRTITSPFKFLDSYKKDDVNTYFGRDKETSSLYELYKDSTIMILHGPSGSGKTSLIYCGLLNRIKKEKRVISIRRNQNLITSIKHKIFGRNEENIGAQLLDNFFSFHSELNKILIDISETERLILEIEDDIIGIKQKKRKTSFIAQDTTTYQQTETLDTSTLISKLKERLGHYADQRKNQLFELKEIHLKIDKTSKSLYTHLINTCIQKGANNSAPLVIFDQFEELFVYGSPQEIDRLGLFLKLVFDHKVPFNIIISLREEYFGYLDQLQSYVPQIFYKKLRLTHPDRSTVKQIIKKSFVEFNINQVADKTKDVIPSEVQDKRIEYILDKVKIQENETESYHFPFLQVYLDRLYKIDYYNTYGRQEKSSTREYLPLELEENEIKDFGTIEKVLQEYIKEINNTIIQNPNNKLNNYSEHKDCVIKFLKHFKTKDDLKKRIPLTIQNDNYYIISDTTVAHKIQNHIWGEVNEEAYNDTLSEIIEELSDKGILKLNTDQNTEKEYAELSHDIIAKVISNFHSTEDDYKQLIKDDFVSSFSLFDEGGQDKTTLLSTQQIERMKPYMDFIMIDEDKERLQRKKLFFEESKKESLKEERERLRFKRRRKKIIFYSLAITCLALTSGILSILLWDSEKENETAELLGHAIEINRYDKTKSFNYVLLADSTLKTKIIQDQENTLVNNFKNNLYKEFLSTPFYHNSIALEEGFELKTTKTRRVDDSLYIFTLSKNNSFSVFTLSYREKNGAIINRYKEDNILAFEPFTLTPNDTYLRTLVLSKHSDTGEIKLQLMDHLANEVFVLKGESISKGEIIQIEHLSGASFLFSIDKKLYKVIIDIWSGQYELQLETSLPGVIEKIKTVAHKDYLVLDKNNHFYTNDSTNIKTNVFNHYLQKTHQPSKKRRRQIEHFKVSTFSIDENTDRLFVGLQGKIMVFDLYDNENIHEHWVHDKELKTIALDPKGNMLIGSRDNGANLFNESNVLIKQFIAHEKPLINVSFVDSDENFIITSSEDNTIKLWNITTDTRLQKDIEAINPMEKTKDYGYIEDQLEKRAMNLNTKLEQINKGDLTKVVTWFARLFKQ
ncbi:AAA family ATPase [Aquimarina sp. D1M17]|uniref:AAA family ATPase n=1 Tax=Aquimarina acroporae TaxID=2937283 RepID=UPI0020BF4421|nr:AAA family ATPase [Aquimarina acroporae]MCK8520043.1 AAA family ATPase [Aquimarina acroporae]